MLRSVSFLAILWGYKTQAIFDVWSIEHVLSGISVGSAVKKSNHSALRKLLGRDHDHHSWYFNLMGVLCVAYMWETLEHYLEEGLAGGGDTVLVPGCGILAQPTDR
ncbi:MAG: hypothetical protein WCG83_01605 [Candidatus Peregrinibacteria bacterium]